MTEHKTKTAKESLLLFSRAVGRTRRSLQLWHTCCPGALASILFSSLFASLSPFVTIRLSALLVDELAGQRRPEMLFRLALAELLSAALLSLCGGMLKRWKNAEAEASRRKVEEIYMDKFFSMDFADLDNPSTYDLYSRIRQNAQWTAWGMGRSLQFFERFITALLRILGGCALSFSLFFSVVPEGGGLSWMNHPLCAAAIPALLLLTAVLSSVCANRGNSYWTRSDSAARLGNRIFSFYGFLSEDRKRAADLRIYEQQEKVCNVYLSAENTFGSGGIFSRFARGPMGLWKALSRGISTFLTGMVYLYVCLKAWAGAFGLGAVTQYVASITKVAGGVSQLISSLGDLRNNAAFLKQTFSFLDIPNKMYQGSLTVEKRRDRKYEVEFRNVSFRYPGREEYALRNVSMKFEVGKRLAVVGRNGSGKTTFIKLLCRLYDPAEGEILLNGIDIRKYDYAEYMTLFSVVFQDFALFSLGLGENVAASADYDEGRAEDALQKAGFGERLSAMERGLETYLRRDYDQDGADVSGGEAQKIAIARALYKDAPFLVMDEPTAALDPVAEAEIYEKLNEIVGDKTAIYISHRLSSCKFCDEILVFGEGAVVQQGTHASLLADEGGEYSRLWSAQAQYYAES